MQILTANLRVGDCFVGRVKNGSTEDRLANSLAQPPRNDQLIGTRFASRSSGARVFFRDEETWNIVVGGTRRETRLTISLEMCLKYCIIER